MDMNPDEFTAVESACNRLVVAYCRCIDTFDDERLLSLFAPDAQWTRSGQAPLTGRVEIANFLASRDRASAMRHISSNFMLTEAGGVQAKGLSYWTVFRSVGHAASTVPQATAPFAVGEYHDSFRRIDGRWHIASRATVYAFRAAG